MWTTLACVAALSLAPNQAGQLKLSNDQVTYGLLGPVRPDSKFLPGDVFFVSFDIENATVDKAGEVQYSMQMEVRDEKNKSLFKQAPRNLKALNSLGGRTLPAFAHVNIGLDQPPGIYTLEVTVTDLGSKSKTSPTATLTRKFQVLPLTFALIRPQLSTIASETPERFPAPNVGVPGQVVWVNFAAVGFKRDDKDKDPNMHVTMEVLDEKGKPTLDVPFTGDANKDVPKNFNLVPMQFWLAFNRPGKFTVRLIAEDKVAKTKSPPLTFPITVIAR
jgi:hypothetical protein